MTCALVPCDGLYHEIRSNSEKRGQAWLKYHKPAKFDGCKTLRFLEKFLKKP